MISPPATRHKYQFGDLSPEDFERLLYWLVKRSDEFDEVQWYGGVRDKGRDVVAYKHTAAGREKWYIQCSNSRFGIVCHTSVSPRAQKTGLRIGVLTSAPQNEASGFSQ